MSTDLPVIQLGKSNVRENLISSTLYVTQTVKKNNSTPQIMTAIDNPPSLANPLLSPAVTSKKCTRYYAGDDSRTCVL
jgi:hypothetical protein